MKTSTVEVGELLSSLSAVGVQRQIAALPGVHHVDVNYVAGSATVHYDETKSSLQDIRQRIIDCGYHCRGEMLPAHVCPPQGHADHAGHDAHVTHDAHAGMPLVVTRRMPPRRPLPRPSSPRRLRLPRRMRGTRATAAKPRTR